MVKIELGSQLFCDASSLDLFRFSPPRRWNNLSERVSWESQLENAAFTNRIAAHYAQLYETWRSALAASVARLRTITHSSCMQPVELCPLGLNLAQLCAWLEWQPVPAWLGNQIGLTKRSLQVCANAFPHHNGRLECLSIACSSHWHWRDLNDLDAIRFECLLGSIYEQQGYWLCIKAFRVTYDRGHIDECLVGGPLFSTTRQQDVATRCHNSD